MTSKSKPTNPFYIVLLIAGVIFVVTACAYVVMTVNARDRSLGGAENASSERFVELVDRYGFAALMIELCVLAGATFAAIATDEYWMRRAEHETERHAKEGRLEDDNS